MPTVAPERGASEVRPTLDSAAIIGQAFELYKRHFGHLFGLALSVFLPVAVIVLLLSFAGVAGYAIGQIVIFVGLFLLLAGVVKAVDDLRDGRADLSVGETFSTVAPRLLPLLVAAIFVGICVAIGLLLFIIPGLVLITYLMAVAPAIVLEGEGPFSSWGRSGSLVSGYWWPVFFVLVLAFLLVFVASFILGLILSPLSEPIRYFISTLVSNAIIAPFSTVAWTLTYFRLRELKGELPEATPEAT